MPVEPMQRLYRHFSFKMSCPHIVVTVGLMPSYDVVLEDIGGGTVRMPFDELASPSYRFA